MRYSIVNTYTHIHIGMCVTTYVLTSDTVCHLYDWSEPRKHDRKRHRAATANNNYTSSVCSASVSLD